MSLRPCRHWQMSKPGAGAEEGHVPQTPPESRILLTLTRLPRRKGPWRQGLQGVPESAVRRLRSRIYTGVPSSQPTLGRKENQKVSITETFSKTSSWLQELSSVGLLEHKDHLTQVRRLVPYSNSITYCFLELEQIT